jgi:hypothetical protein
VNITGINNEKLASWILINKATSKTELKKTKKEMEVLCPQFVSLMLR